MERRKKDQQDSVYIPETQEDVQKAGAGSNGNTVVVALCHPHGIQFLLDGGKRRVKLNGNAANLRGQAKGVLPVGGFGLTEIPEADWQAIQAAYGKMEIFTSGLCFASEKRRDVLAEADDKAELRHGREPVDVGALKTQPADMAEA